MPKGLNQKLKMLYIANIFHTYTDNEHGLTLQEITDKLNKCDVNADRKTLYTDFDELKRYGMDIVSYQEGRMTYYNLASRDFELPELKLLVDSVQSAKFMTEKKSRELIKKLEGLASKYEAQQLSREVIISGRVKTVNENIYYNVDKIHSAISQNKQISFQYFQWNTDKEMVLRHGGDLYHVSPWALVWDDENYYLVGYDAEENLIKHYRVDKMLNMEILENERLGKEQFEEKKGPSYSKRIFGMFGGEPVKVTIEAENSMVGVFIDRFGKDIFIAKTDKEHFRISVDVEVSNQFLGWIFALGKGVRVISPEFVVDKMRERVKEMSEEYLG